MKPRRNAQYRAPEPTEPLVLREVSNVPAIGDVISVRAAKAHLSALLDLVAAGRDIVIASDGEPKVRLVSYSRKPPRRTFAGAASHLATMPVPKPGRPSGPASEDLIRADRDGRGW